MEFISFRDKNFWSGLQTIFKRETFPNEIVEDVRHILKEVNEKEDEALCEYAYKLDGADLTPEKLLVSEKEINEAENAITDYTKEIIDSTIKNIKDYARKQLPSDWKFSPRNGVELGEKFFPLHRVGAYIPGGTAPLVSTILHTICFAKTAGVKEIVGITPPRLKNGKILPEIIYAMNKAGAKEIYKLGGVYGIGALAYGTPTVKKVEKIVGPGNAFVTAAKKEVYGTVSLDMVAGPSEIMIIGDKDNNPAYIAADMLSQAEHGSGYEQAVLVTDSKELIKKVENALLSQAKKLSRETAVNKVIEKGIFFIETNSMQQAVEVANEYAPEHIEILSSNAEEIADKISTAGAIFIGEYTPEPVGDFVAGPSHVLPTGGSAKYFSGLTVNSFFRRTSTVKYTKDALNRELPIIEEISNMEGLQAHKRSASIRFNQEA